MILPLLVLGCADEITPEGVHRTDVFQQASGAELDVLWVVSDAATMADAQAALGEGVEAFADEVEERALDVHAGVISTSFRYEDPDRGVLLGDPPWLATGDLRSALPDHFLVGTAATEERGLTSAVFALDPVLTVDGSPNAGFRRADVDLALVFVSTRDDVYGGPPEDAVDELQELAGGRDRLTITSVVGAAGGACADPADRYLTVAALGGGAAADVCDLSEDPSLGFPDLSSRSGVAITTFELSEAPVPSSLVVRVDDEEVGEDPASGWTYDSDVGPAGAIVFHGDAVPPLGAQIHVQYDER